MLTYPVAVISYNRPDLLKVFLESLKRQSFPVDPKNIALFQDNGDPANDACIATFRTAFPKGKVFAARDNLGVALNMDRAERYIFEELGADVGFFFEDDLILGPHYIAALKQLVDFALKNERIGYVAAYGVHTASREEQVLRNRELVWMEHHWGFALTKRQWEMQRPIIEPYLEIIRQRPYRQRDAAAIRSYFLSLGYPQYETSQDAAKHVALLVLGVARVRSFACFAKYEGRDGLHMRPEQFEKIGYDKTELYGGEPELIMPSSEQIDNWIAKSRTDMITEAEKRNAALSAPPAEKHPEPASPQLQRKWSSADIKLFPHMEEEGRLLLEERLMSAKCFLEYGAGGSTVMATILGVPTIISVESDADYLVATDEAVKARGHSTTFYAHHADIGPTGEWGKPIDRSNIDHWPRYAGSVWSRIASEKLPQPDLVLIDGRFRVASVLATMLMAKKGTRILFDDYYDRPFYHIIEKYVRPKGRAGRMAEFVVPRQPLERTAIADLLAMSTDFN